MPSEQVSVQQRRKQTRYGILAEDVQITLGGTPVYQTRGHIDISERGMFIPIDGPHLQKFQQDQNYEFAWKLYGRLSGPVLHARGSVIGVNPFGIEVGFTSMDKPTEILLGKLVKLLRGESLDQWPAPSVRDKLDTYGAVVAALGVGCGLIGLNLVNRSPTAALICLGAMIASVFIYAILRFIRGPWRGKGYGNTILWP